MSFPCSIHMFTKHGFCTQSWAQIWPIRFPMHLQVDDFLLPGTDDSNGGFTLDFARPIEWICTCPLMQAVGGRMFGGGCASVSAPDV